MTWKIHEGDARVVLPRLADESVHCVVTSPPYWHLRDYGVAGQLGQEDTPTEFVEQLVAVFREVRRVLRSDGTLWLNMGDSYAGAPGGYQGKHGMRASRTFTARIKNRKGGDGLKPKDLVGIPWRTALALQADGWWLRSEIIWHKRNPMPETVYDRPSRDHEHIFLLTKSASYYYDADAISEETAPKTKTVKTSQVKGDGSGSTGEKVNAWMAANGGRHHPERRNKRTVWGISPRAFDGEHFATFPPDLVVQCLLAGCPEGGTVLDPFSGAGTTGMVALRLQRHYIGVELSPAYARMSRKRIAGDAPLLNVEAAS